MKKLPLGLRSLGVESFAAGEPHERSAVPANLLTRG
jgi:hypothetical protein